MNILRYLFYFCIFFLFFRFSLSAQQTTLTGAIVVGKTEFMSYQVTYTLNDNNGLTGYSVCDLSGKEETKARITGVFNPKKKTLSFEEKSILSTRSATPIDEFCLMKVMGRFDKKAGKFVFTGTFGSKCGNPKVRCDSGTIVLMTEKDVYELAAKAAKVLEKAPLPDSVKQEIKEKAPPLAGVRKVIELNPASETEFDLKSDFLQFDLFDDKFQDGDKVTILMNDKKVASQFEITNKVKSLKFRINKEDSAVTFTIIADDEGEIPPTTVKAVLRNGNESDVILANLKKGESVKIIFRRK
jgi:hypothetical protein